MREAVPAPRAGSVREVCAVGVDLTPVADVADAVARFGARYTGRIFTEHELACSKGRDRGAASATSLAARFAAKEAALKVLAPSGSRPEWRDIEVRRRANGACEVRLHRRAAALASARRLGPMSVSLSHEAGLAVAVVVAMRDPTRGPPLAGATSTPSDPASPHDHDRSCTMTITDESTGRIRGVLAEHARLPIDVAALTEDDDLFQAGMTSHASVNVMLALEDAFDVEFPEAMLRKSTFASIGALRRALAELQSTEVRA